MEDLFTPSELEDIRKQAQHPRWANPYLIGLGFEKTSLFCVSVETGLMLARGNEFTGMKHIRTRHQFGRQEWKKGEIEQIDGASQFGLDTAPIDYMFIAESIYKKENLKPKLNDKPGAFDVYEGKHTHQGKKSTYRLVVYKDTPIIHTLFPVSDKRNKKQVLNLRAGGTGFSHYYHNEQVTYTINYYNKAGKAVIKLIIRGIVGYRLERYYVEVSEAVRAYPVTTFIKEVAYEQAPVHSPIRASQFDVSDTSMPELEIAKMLEGAYDYDAGNGESVRSLVDPASSHHPSFFAW